MERGRTQQKGTMEQTAFYSLQRRVLALVRRTKTLYTAPHTSSSTGPGCSSQRYPVLHPLDTIILSTTTMDLFVSGRIRFETAMPAIVKSEDGWGQNRTQRKGSAWLNQRALTLRWIAIAAVHLHHGDCGCWSDVPIAALPSFSGAVKQTKNEKELSRITCANILICNCEL